MSTRLAYSYTRFSSRAQAHGDSARRQGAGFKEWCERHGATPADNYADLGVSAFRGKNAAEGALGEFLRAVEAGKVPPGSVLVVESLDRISRLEVNRAMPIFLQIINAGVSVATLADGHLYEPDSPNMMMELMYSLLIMTRANEESATKSKRLSAAWKRKRDEATNTPMTKQGPGWLKLENGGWQVIEERAAVVRRMFSLAAGGDGLHAIARKLNEDGLRTFRGKMWSAATVRLILDGRAVLGEFTPHVRQNGKREALEPIEGYFPAIVDVETWAKVQRLRGRRRHQRGNQAEAVPNPFRGLIFTPDGEPYHTKTHNAKGKVYRYLRTHNDRDSNAVARSWNFEEFMALFVAVAKEAGRVTIEAGEPAARAQSLRLPFYKGFGSRKNLTKKPSPPLLAESEGSLRGCLWEC